MQNITTEKKKNEERRKVEAVENDFLARRAARKALERTWQLNEAFIAGKQYFGINSAGELEEEQKDYGWQTRRVFNRIAPTVELRCAKLSRMRPALAVRAPSDDDGGRAAAALSAAILGAAEEEGGLNEALSRATVWSETCGTSFYKVVWDNCGGKVVGEADGVCVHEGCAKVTALSPYEIYPYSLDEESVQAQPSVIHARALSVQDIFSAYGVKLAGGGDKFGKLEEGYEMLIEKYSRPTEEAPEGRFTVVAGGRLLYDGALPYINGKDGVRDYPFIKQVCMPLAGKFFGTSVVERMIPVQRAYNAVRNRKHEFLNRISVGIMAVEEGSVDTDELAEDGLRPGKVIVYRRGGKPPEMLSPGSLPDAFEREENTLRDEFAAISGTGDITQNADTFASVTSATGLQLIIEQDDARLNVCYESIKHALKETGRQILRLYRQFACAQRLVKGKDARMYCFAGTDITADDVILESDGDINLTPAERRNVIYELIEKGLLTDENGRLTRSARNKALEYIGYGSFADGPDTDELHARRAEEENSMLAEKSVPVNDYDEHSVHIQRHTALLLSGRCDSATEKRLAEHIEMHNKKIKEEKVNG